MIISFDLDDTLIPGTKQFETEKRNIFQQVTSQEKIRSGTIILFKELRARGHSIHIYTTSLRSIAYIKFIFYSYGIHVDEIINQQRHNSTLREKQTMASKFPPAFDIDIHVEDSPGLKIKGDRFQFKTIIIHENDKNWVNTILEIL
jgi:FMN phosphatase YigB (HAD superfamily)